MSGSQQRRKSEKYDYLVKVIIIGDSGVGKTNLITRFCENNFKDTYVATIGVDFKIKSLFIDDKKFKMQIWDTAGQQRFKNITQTYYKGAAGIVLTYSIVDQSSFENIERWITQIQNNAPKNVSKILIGTKTDLQQQRKISQQTGLNLAKKYNLPYVEVSSKTGFQVKEVFQTLLQEIKKKYDEQGEVIGLNEQSEVYKAKLQYAPEQKNKNCSC